MNKFSVKFRRRLERNSCWQIYWTGKINENNIAYTICKTHEGFRDFVACYNTRRENEVRLFSSSKAHTTTICRKYIGKKWLLKRVVNPNEFSVTFWTNMFCRRSYELSAKVTGNPQAAGEGGGGNLGVESCRCRCRADPADALCVIYRNNVNGGMKLRTKEKHEEAKLNWDDRRVHVTGQFDGGRRWHWPVVVCCAWRSADEIGGCQLRTNCSVITRILLHHVQTLQHCCPRSKCLRLQRKAQYLSVAVLRCVSTWATTKFTFLLHTASGSGIALLHGQCNASSF